MPLKYGFSNPLAVCSDICLPVSRAIQSVTLPVQRRQKRSPRHLGFLEHRWVFRYLQRPVLLSKPLDPASTAWGSGRTDLTALASGSLLPAELQHWERGLCLLSSHDLQQFGITLAVY